MELTSKPYGLPTTSSREFQMIYMYIHMYVYTCVCVYVKERNWSGGFYIRYTNPLPSYSYFWNVQLYQLTFQLCILKYSTLPTLGCWTANLTINRLYQTTFRSFLKSNLMFCINISIRINPKERYILFPLNVTQVKSRQAENVNCYIFHKQN